MNNQKLPPARMGIQIFVDEKQVIKFVWLYRTSLYCMCSLCLWAFSLHTATQTYPQHSNSLNHHPANHPVKITTVIQYTNGMFRVIVFLDHIPISIHSDWVACPRLQCPWQNCINYSTSRDQQNFKGTLMCMTFWIWNATIHLIRYTTYRI